MIDVDHGGAVSTAGNIDNIHFQWNTACGMVAAATLFNMVLCFIASRGVPVALPAIAGAELSIIIAATVVVRQQAFQTLFVESLLFGMYSLALFVMHPADDPKVSIEIGMMAAFFLLGRHKCTRRQASGLVWFLVLLTLSVGIFEYLAQSTFEQWFNIFNYYVGKGDEEVQRAYITGTNLAENGMRTVGQGRELLPGLLGLHRVGSIFLEPVSAGNFATICVAWIVSIRYYRASGYLLAFLALTIGILADARFAVFSSAAVAAFLMIPVWRSRLLVAAIPIAAVLFLLVFGAVDRHVVDNTIIGRLHYSGDLLGNWTLPNWMGFTDAADRSPDTGYSYFLGNLGLLPCAIVWALLCIRHEGTDESARFFCAMTLYCSLSLSISGSCLSIKTAALLWFLYGVLQTPEEPETSTAN